jgi:hypothetical protein
VSAALAPEDEPVTVVVPARAQEGRQDEPLAVLVLPAP